jgi:hypothetical protein
MFSSYLANDSLSQGNQKLLIHPLKPKHPILHSLNPQPSQFEPQHGARLLPHAVYLPRVPAMIPNREKRQLISNIQGRLIVISLPPIQVPLQLLEHYRLNFYDLLNDLDKVLEILLLQCGFIIILPLSVSIPRGPLNPPLLSDNHPLHLYKHSTSL